MHNLAALAFVPPHPDGYTDFVPISSRPAPDQGAEDRDLWREKQSSFDSVQRSRTRRLLDNGDEFMRNSLLIGVHFSAIQSFEILERTERDPKLEE
jgi:hypothetical protein